VDDAGLVGRDERRRYLPGDADGGRRRQFLLPYQAAERVALNVFGDDVELAVGLEAVMHFER
jgi:hypothetical protein